MPDVTVADYLDEWPQRRRGQRGYAEAIRYYVKPQLAALQLAELTGALERTYAVLLSSGGKRGRGLAPRTIQYAAAVLHRAMEDAVLDGLLVAH